MLKISNSQLWVCQKNGVQIKVPTSVKWVEQISHRWFWWKILKQCHRSHIERNSLVQPPERNHNENCFFFGGGIWMSIWMYEMHNGEAENTAEAKRDNGKGGKQIYAKYSPPLNCAQPPSCILKLLKLGFAFQPRHLYPKWRYHTKGRGFTMWCCTYLLTQTGVLVFLSAYYRPAYIFSVTRRSRSDVGH